MKKIPTLFRRDPDDMRYVTCEVNPACQWVLDGEGVATRKYDGTCVRLDDGGNWWARREVKLGRKAPEGFVVAEHDDNTGKTVGWEPIYQSAFVTFWDEAFTNRSGDLLRTGTYELCGPKINGNPEGFERHVLIPHGMWNLSLPEPLAFETLRDLFADLPHEGIVWHHQDGRMAKLKTRDFPGSRSPWGVSQWLSR